jgi:hypothetical protein
MVVTRRYLAAPSLLQAGTVAAAVLGLDFDRSGPGHRAGTAVGVARRPWTPRGHLAIHHSAGLLEVLTAVAQLEACMVAVARLVAQVLDDGVEGRLLHDTRRIPSRTAQLRLAATACGDDVQTDRHHHRAHE